MVAASCTLRRVRERVSMTIKRTRRAPVRTGAWIAQPAVRLMHRSPDSQYGVTNEDRDFDSLLRPLAAPEPELVDIPIIHAQAPVRTVQHAPRATRKASGRPTCDRCGQVFKTSNGKAWHVANRPTCDKQASKVA